jgi:hypothetical protein
VVDAEDRGRRLDPRLAGGQREAPARARGKRPARLEVGQRALDPQRQRAPGGADGELAAAARQPLA